MTFHNHLLSAAVMIAGLSVPAAAQSLRPPQAMEPIDAFAGRMIHHPNSSYEMPPPVAEYSGGGQGFLLSRPRPSQPELDFTPITVDPSYSVDPYQRLDELTASPAQLVAPRNPNRPPDARDGFFQKLIFTATALDWGGTRGLGWTELDIRSVFAFPCPTSNSPMVLTPGYEAVIIEWPDSPDLPSLLHGAYMQFRWMSLLNERWAVDAAVTPGVFSDFDSDSDDWFRISGHAVAQYTSTPRTKWILGVAYLDREDVGLLPVGGVIWTPHDDVKFELVAPRPRIAQRIYWHGACTDEVQDWVYVAGEFGGGTWSIQRADGSDDILTYRDFRAIVGIERKSIGKLDYRFEMGYVFERQLEYKSATPDVKPTDTFMVRVGATY